jgi:hypothetical protein
LVEKISSVQGRVLDADLADSRTKKPFLALRFGVERLDSLRGSFEQLFYVWPYVDKTGYTELDGLAEEIREALHGQTVGGFFMEYRGRSLQEAYSDPALGLTLPLEFRFNKIYE